MDPAEDLMKIVILGLILGLALGLAVVVWLVWGKWTAPSDEDIGFHDDDLTDLFD